MLAASILIVVATGMLGLKNDSDRMQADGEADAARKVDDAASDLLATVTDAETGQRGYVLTGEEPYLDTYNSAAGRIEVTLQQLRNMSANRPYQKVRVAALEPWVKAKMRELAKTVQLRRTNGLAAALAVVNSGRGKQYMDEIRAACGAIQESAHQREQHFAQVAEASAHRLRLVNTAGSLALLAFLIYSTVTIFRGLTLRENLFREAAASADMWGTTLNSIGDGVIVIDSFSRVTFINPVAQELTGWSEAEAVGTALEKVFPIVNESTRAIVANPAQEAMETGIIVSLANHTVLIQKHGPEIAIEDSGAAIRADGRIVGAILVFRDVSKRREDERRIEESNAQLQQFVSGAAHDLRAPIRSASAMTDLLAKQIEAKIDEPQKELLLYIQNGMRHMLGLIDDLLTYAQASHFESSAVGKTDMEPVLRKVTENLRSDIENSGATISLGKLATVPMSETHLLIMFQNLIGNALKYHGPQPPLVKVSSEVRANECMVSVSDNGIGIPVQYCSEIFKPFKRLHGQERPGNGIGLATCRKIVEGYGGKIGVKSEEGKGATFWFWLPLDKNSNRLN